jgi:hypothetical protein
MRFSDWEPVYRRVCLDMGYDPADDEMSVRILKAVTLNSDLISDDDLGELIGPVSTVFGAARRLESDIDAEGYEGTTIAAGSSIGRVMAKGIIPDIQVTDLDGDIGDQLEASSRGSVTLIHAHGGNMDLVRQYANMFRGPVVLTTQSEPENTVYDFGGFTDGDRAVCMAAHFGSKVLLRGFDFTVPMEKAGSDPEVKSRKLRWAKEIIESQIGPTGIDRM